MPNELSASCEGTAALDTADTVLIDRILDHINDFARLGPMWQTDDFLAIDVTMSQAKLLHVVLAEPDLSLSALAARLGVGLPTLSSMVERLVEHGLVARREDPADRRQVRVALTSTGIAQMERFRELNQQAMTSCLALLDHDDLLALERGIRALLERVSAARDLLVTQAAGRAPAPSVATPARQERTHR